MKNWMIISSICIVLLACAPHAEIIVTDSVPMDGDSLKESIGIEILGGIFSPLLEKGCNLPCEITQIFSTAEDGQSQIMLNLFQGDVSMASEAKHLGKYQITGIHPAPRGVPEVAITLRVEVGRFVLLAKEKGGGKDQLKWVIVE
jgi:molecular chaperone DnaK